MYLRTEPSKPSHRVQIRAQVAGQLGAIHFAEGQDVTRGQLLFELDPRPFELALAQAEAVLAKDAAQNANVGDLVRANDTAPMVVINQMSPINVTFAVPGRLLDDIRRYQAAVPLNVEAVMNEPGGRQPSGHITFIDNAVDQATGTIKLKALFDNADRRLWPGEFVNVNLQLTTEPHAVVTPASAVQTGQNGAYAYVVRPNRTVEMRPVKVARIAGAESVIASGLQPGETVVTDGQLRLTPGARVTVHGWPVATTGATR